MANAPMRNALARFFGILERSGRYLMLGHVSRSLCSVPIRSGKSVWQRTRRFHAFLSMLRTATQAYHLNREGLVFARGHLKLTAMCQRRACMASRLPCENFHPFGGLGFSTEIFGRLEKHFFIIRPKLHALCLLLLGCFCTFANFFHPCTSMSNQAWIQVLGHLLKQIRETSTLDKKCWRYCPEKVLDVRVAWQPCSEHPLRNLAN